MKRFFPKLNEIDLNNLQIDNIGEYSITRPDEAALISEIIKLNKIKISSFGTFTVLNKNERMGRNPMTKVDAKIFSRKVVKFKPSLLVKKKINGDEK